VFISAANVYSTRAWLGASEEGGGEGGGREGGGEVVLSTVLSSSTGEVDSLLSNWRMDAIDRS